MVPLSDDQIQEIAESFDMGLSCFLNKVTGELVFIPKRENAHLVEIDSFAEEVKKIKKDKKTLLK